MALQMYIVSKMFSEYTVRTCAETHKTCHMHRSELSLYFNSLKNQFGIILESSTNFTSEISLVVKLILTFLAITIL